MSAQKIGKLVYIRIKGSETLIVSFILAFLIYSKDKIPKGAKWLRMNTFSLVDNFFHSERSSSVVRFRLERTLILASRTCLAT